ncbi:cytochrome-c peroxidase [Aestuariibius insulae]|uniref:cytochrome-c peroxidase n=1 Tax=Aestuariibius insulae TaxID=2058287 RepID=UPI00345EBD06
MRNALAGLFLSLPFAALATTLLADGMPAPVDPADYAAADPDEIALGQLLFYDPILSGNRAVSCASCHHPAFATSDGLALGLGDGGRGLGPARRADPTNLPEQRIPRNSPALFNLGHAEFTTLFHDGRIEVRADGTLRTPLGDDMSEGFASILSAQTMFPVLSPDEMAGHYSENEISQAIRMGRITGEGGAWHLISGRVAGIPAYAEAFRIYPHIDAPEDIAFTDISNAIAAFIAHEWRSEDSPFDAHLRGERPLAGAAAEGMALFYGEAGCAACHSGPFQTDHGFHAMGAPQIGPGKAARFESHARDEGRFRVTGEPADLYAFRTPSLRNVTRTGPWGHAGTHANLRAFLRDHADPKAGSGRIAGLIETVRLPDLPVEDFRIAGDAAETRRIADAAIGVTATLSERDLDALMSFLAALDDPVALEGRLGSPDAVPSGLPVDHP